jgi:RimJ/RimL family protein N-acetyltransferase
VPGCAVWTFDAARRPGAPHHLHAFPSVGNASSNALCRRLGFTLLGACDFEYPAGSGTLMRSNDWRLDLTTAITAPGARPADA